MIILLDIKEARNSGCYGQTTVWSWMLHGEVESEKNYKEIELIDELIKKMWYINTMEYYSAIKSEWNLAICCNINRLQGFYAKWNKSDQKRQIIPDFTYIWNQEYKEWNRNRVIDSGNKLLIVRVGRSWGVGKVGEGNSEVQTSRYKIIMEM